MIIKTPPNTPDNIKEAFQAIIAHLTALTQRGILYRPCDIPDGKTIMDCIIFEETV